MPDLKSELSKVINSWETQLPNTHTESGRPVSNNATRITFNYVRDNPGVARAAAIAGLTKLGVKVSSSTSLITVMLARGNVRLANGGLFATQTEYKPLPNPKPRVAKKAAPVAVTPVAVTPVAVTPVAELPVQPVATTYATPAEWTVESVIGSLNVRQAMAVYDELRKIFGG